MATFLLLLALLAPKECSLKVSPLIAMSPMKFLHLTIHLENPSKWFIGTIFILDDFSEVTRHQLFEGDMALKQPKTVEEDWKTLSLDTGIYEMQLVVANREGERCVAVQRLEVKGNDQ